MLASSISHFMVFEGVGIVGHLLFVKLKLPALENAFKHWRWKGVKSQTCLWVVMQAVFLAAKGKDAKGHCFADASWWCLQADDHSSAIPGWTLLCHHCLPSARRLDRS